MATVQYSTVPDLVGVRNCAYNDDLTSMVACNTNGQVTVCHRSSQQRSWQKATELPIATTAATTQVAWAHSEHGSVIACASEDGLVTVWQQAQTISGQDPCWIQRAALADSIQPITSLHFAPVQLGPQLAVASDDGFVRFYEPSAVLNADKWQLRNDLQASQSGSCQCLSWRQHTYGMPPMLCLGSSEGASVWYYRKSLGDWIQAAVLDTHSQIVSSIDWAAALGRPVELIAAASSAGVFIWSLKGKAHELQVQQMDCLSSDGNSITDCLPVDGDVWKVQFDKMGSLLATSASDGANSNVCVWELNPEGQWYLLSKIVGGTELDEME